MASNFQGKVKEAMTESHKEHENWNLTLSCNSLEEIIKNSAKVVYLSADAGEDLSEVDSESTYVIGGLVDRNRHKGVSFERASKLGVKIAKLPLKQFVDLKSSPVLTVYHVFEILLKQRETGSWKKAIEETVPQRKQQ